MKGSPNWEKIDRQHGRQTEEKLNRHSTMEIQPKTRHKRVERFQRREMKRRVDGSYEYICGVMMLLGVIYLSGEREGVTTS